MSGADECPRCRAGLNGEQRCPVCGWPDLFRPGYKSVTVRVEDTSKGIHIHDEPSKEFKIVLAIIIFAVCFSLGYIVDRLLEGAL